MPNFLKNVSGKTIIIGDLKISWSPNRVINLDDLDADKLIKHFDTIKDNMERGWLVSVDKKGNPIKKMEVTVEKVRGRKQKLAEGMTQVMEYAERKNNPDFNLNEMNEVGSKTIMHGKYELRQFVMLHHFTAMNILKKEKWIEDDLEDLKLIRRHDHRKGIKDFLDGIILKLEAESDINGYWKE